MKGFPAWPGKVIEPKPEIKVRSKKNHQFVFFFGSENYAWVPNESIWLYPEHKSRFTLTSRIPKGFKEAMESVEDILKANAATASASVPEADASSSSGDLDSNKSDNPDLPSIEEEIAQIFGDKSEPTPKKDYSREPLASKSSAKKSPMGSANGDADEENSGEDEPLSKLSDSKEAPAKEKRERKPPKKNEDFVTDFDEEAKTKKVKDDQVEKVKKERKRKAESTPPRPKVKNQKLLVKFGGTPSKCSPIVSPVKRQLVPNADSGTAIIEQKNIIPTPAKIGFIGLGIMGNGMVTNLLASGHEVTIWNRSPHKCKEHTRVGALKVDTPVQVVKSCDITFSCVSDPAAVKDIVFGNSGILEGICSGKGYVDMSTIDVETVTDINEAINAKGGRFLEAPVSGNKFMAETGQLIILTAGDKKLYKDCYSCFEAMGHRTVYLGEVGNGARMKLINSSIMGTMLTGLAEGLALAEKVGLDQEEVLQVLDFGSLSCPLIKDRGKAMMEGRYEPENLVRNFQKDMRLAINMGDQTDQPLPVTAVSNELFKKAKAMGYADNDVSAVIRAIDA
ncbi:unnamed protein product [Owenia fusiformis]|uniref:Cytokine-like nuclear factor N-PAC n=1 Tax=Owenia fusiformis TaxID=6347 RepID=A0A8J1TJD3_OWEFU|nr:unnamed protein product [Owenia fusiformis]